MLASKVLLFDLGGVLVETGGLEELPRPLGGSSAPSELRHKWELGCRAGEIAFFDDGPENVDGAARAGLSAHLTASPDDLRAALARLDLL